MSAAKLPDHLQALGQQINEIVKAPSQWGAHKIVTIGGEFQVQKRWGFVNWLSNLLSTCFPALREWYTNYAAQDLSKQYKKILTQHHHITQGMDFSAARTKAEEDINKIFQQAIASPSAPPLPREMSVPTPLPSTAAPSQTQLSFSGEKLVFTSLDLRTFQKDFPGFELPEDYRTDTRILTDESDIQIFLLALANRYNRNELPPLAPDASIEQRNLWGTINQLKKR